MADPTTTSPAADAAKPSTADGVTPPAVAVPATTQAEGRMTPARAREVLDGISAKRPEATERDPLLSPEPPDPLFAKVDDGDPLEHLINAAPETVAAPEEAAPVSEAPAAPAETQAAEVPPAEEAASGEEEGRKRFNINRKTATGEYVHDAQERAMMRLAAEEGISLAEASRRLFGETAAPAERAAEPAAPAAVTPPGKTSADIGAEIERMKAERREAAKAFDQDRNLELTEKIETLIEEKAAAREREQQQAQQQTRAQTTFQQSVETSIATVTGLFPDSAKAGTELHDALTLEVARLQKAGSPIFGDPEWPEALAAKVAAKLGIAPKSTAAPKPIAPAAPIAPKAPVTPAKPAVPLPAPGAVSAPAQVNRGAEISRLIQEAKKRGDLPALQALTAQLVRAA